MSLVKDYMTPNFKILSCDLSPQEAIAALPGKSIGVIENASQQPIGVVTLSEIEAAIATHDITLVSAVLTSPSLLKVGCEAEMQAVVDSSLLTKLNDEAKAALVIDESSLIVGILTVDAICKFISSGSSEQKGVVLSTDPTPYVAGTQLGGALSPLTAYCLCYECWHVNELSAEQWSVLEHNPSAPLPTCQSPNQPQHLLKKPS